MKTALILIPLIILLLVGIALVKRSHNTMVHALPPSVQSSPAEVQLLVLAGVDMVAVQGTGSMRPYIPSGNAANEIVAYVSIERVPFSDLKQGDLVTYRTQAGNILHQLAAKDGDGWIASGLHNAGYDRSRVTVSNFTGRVVKTYIVK